MKILNTKDGKYTFLDYLLNGINSLTILIIHIGEVLTAYENPTKSKEIG